MKQEPSIPENLFFTHAVEIEEIFRLAVREELLKHKKLGHSIATSQDGKVVVLSAEEIPVDDGNRFVPRPTESDIV